MQITDKRWLALILISFVVLGVIYALVTPPFEASDELWHYPMVRHLADGNPLPVQVFDPELAGPWKQEASQPPLYYYLGAALTFWIDTSDMPDVRRENPHVDNGIITKDGNTNLVIHDSQNNPLQGTLLALRLVRLMSVLMGAGTVYLTYHIAAAAMPGRSEIALGAAAVNAFLPMFLFISGAVNNDNLAILLASLGLFLMILIVAANNTSMPERQEKTFLLSYFSWLLLGCVIGLAVLTKQGTIGLLPLGWGAAFLVAWQRSQAESTQSAGRSPVFTTLLQSAARSLVLFLLVLLPVFLIAGWWYWRNIQLYGDLLGWNAFIAVLGQRAHPASLIQLWGERRGFLMAYWGLFGGVNIPMPDWIYVMFNSLLVVAIAGFSFVALQEIARWLRLQQGTWQDATAVVDNLIQFIIDRFAMVASLLFAAAVIAGLVRWATTTWSSQGRLVFTAIAALSTLFATGLVGWLPQPAARRIMAGISLIFLLVAAAAPFLWIYPAYQPETYDKLTKDVDFVPYDMLFGNQMKLVGAAVQNLDIASDAVRPGDEVWVHLQWETVKPMTEDWSVFVHAVDPVLGSPITQRDMYPGQGLEPTSFLAQGSKLTDAFRLQMPDTAVAPATLEIVAGLYDVATGERLITPDGRDSIDIGELQLLPLDGEVPNPVDVNFENLFNLDGYSIAPRSAAPGETIELVLYVRPIRQIDKDYTFFAQIVDEDTTRWASIDIQPLDGTSAWPAAEIQELPMKLELAADTPAGIYPLILGIYTQDGEGQFDRLQIQTTDGRLTDDFLELTRIRVAQ